MANKDTLDFNIVDKNVIKVINFDDENLSLSLKQKLVFDRVTTIFTNVDNVCRVLLPNICYIYFSYNELWKIDML